jgi:hypothetical protein
VFPPGDILRGSLDSEDGGDAVLPENFGEIFVDRHLQAISQRSSPPLRVQYGRARGTGWTGVFHVAKFRAMTPLNLSDDELQDAAQAARIACVQAENDSEKQSSPR